MKEFNCKYCQTKLDITLLEYKANKYCNTCFEERLEANKLTDQSDYNKVVFWGIEIDLDEDEECRLDEKACNKIN